MPNLGPILSEYGKRYYTNSLTKEEQKELHKQRMKNDPEYKEKVKVERLRKKASNNSKTTNTPKGGSTKVGTMKISRGAGGGVGGIGAFSTKQIR